MTEKPKEIITTEDKQVSISTNNEADNFTPIEKEIEKEGLIKLIETVETTNNQIISTKREVERLSKSVASKRENARTGLAITLLATLSLTIIGTFYYIFNPPQNSNGNNSDSKDLITLIWTTQVSLLGSALGFYFGNSNSVNNNTSNNNSNEKNE